MTRRAQTPLAFYLEESAGRKPNPPSRVRRQLKQENVLDALLSRVTGPTPRAASEPDGNSKCLKCVVSSVVGRRCSLQNSTMSDCKDSLEVEGQDEKMKPYHAVNGGSGVECEGERFLEEESGEGSWPHLVYTW
ncbi:hypothetical protein BaRGS_00009879 [Batillaria attramentaria]|uniref:Uncharacterized protein n=1 Tax=Batillaria attramentaria TaxID=370345 RepID=A0ABD0LHG0_9CAEN